MSSPFKSKTAIQVFELCRSGDKVPGKTSKIINMSPDIFLFAAKNGVAPWCYYKLNNCLDKSIQWTDELKNKFRMQYLQTMLMNQQKWKVFKEMNVLARDHGITIVPLKGTALAFTLYPQESLRPMGDIDILIPEEDISKFRDLMLQNGAKRLYPPLSRLHERFHAHISPLAWQNIMIEPHQRLFDMGSRLNLKKANLFDYLRSTKEHPDIQIFNDVMQVYHSATHVFKGYKMGGMRLGWLLDIALLLHRNQSDPGFIEKVIKLNPQAREQVLSVLQWASSLNSLQPDIKPKIPFPDEAMFHAEQNTEKRHKLIVLNEISNLPGIHNKLFMLFREFFPEKSYMYHKYGKHSGLALFKLYLKRITGSINSE